MNKNRHMDILSVEDEPDSVGGTLSELELMGYSVDQVHSVYAAREYIARYKIGILLVDLRLPMAKGGGIDEFAGLKLLKLVRQDKDYIINSRTPFILLTAQGVLFDKRRGYKDNKHIQYIKNYERVKVFDKVGSIFEVTKLIDQALSI